MICPEKILMVLSPGGTAGGRPCKHPGARQRRICYGILLVDMYQMQACVCK